VIARLVPQGRRARPCPPLLEGVLAGLVFALADGLAAGLVRTPPALWTLLLVSGALAGLFAGLVGQLARTRGVALGLVVAGTLAVHGVSLVTKELPPELPAALRALCVLAIVALAGATGVSGALGLTRHRHAGFWAAFLLASVPATSLLWWALPHRQVFLASACLLPFAVALLPAFVGAWASARSLATAAILVALALALPSTADAQRKRRSKRRAPKPAPAATTPPEATPSPSADDASDGDGDTGRGGKTKVFDFTGLELGGRMRTPQLLYFLDRADEELGRAALEQRTFIPEMTRTMEDEGL
jgi:hypothetical protein